MVGVAHSMMQQPRASLLCLRGLLVLAPALAVAAQEAGGSHTSITFDDVARTLSESALKSAHPQKWAEKHATTVSVEVYYGAMCGHCLQFIRQAMLPLLEAGLPGDRVSISIWPWVPKELSLNECLMNLPCTYSMAPICALNYTLPQPAEANSSALQRVMDFLFCDLLNTAMGATPPMNRKQVPQCAQQAGVEWSGHRGLQTCSEGDAGFNLLSSPWYRNRIDEVKHKLEKLPDQMAPFIFLDGQVLMCPGPQWCKSTRTVAGDRDLETPGSLLRVVCSRLIPAPQVCRDMFGDGEDEEPEVKKACENCVETGAFRNWRRRIGGKQGLPVAALAAFCAAAALAVLVVAAIVVKRASKHRRGSSSEDALPLTLEDERCLSLGEGRQQSDFE